MTAPAIQGFSLKRLTSDFVLEGLLVLIIIFLMFAAPGFATTGNVLNILRNASTTGIVAMGMTFILIAGEIDLAVGSALAFFGCLLAVIVDKMSGSGLPMGLIILIAVLSCMLLGILSGCFSGWVRHKFAVPTFITTLAWSAAFRGGGYLITDSFPVTPFPEWFSFFGAGYFLGIPFQAIVFLVVLVVMWFVSKYTTFGRSVYAIGGNAESARLSGINVKRNRMIIMAITSFLAVVAAIITASQIQAGNPTVGNGWEFSVISACVIGGVSMAGGKGRIWSTFVGVMFLEILLNGMTLMNIDEYWQYVAKAILILGAVLIYQSRDMRKQRKA
jgi:sugar transport system permease protein